MVREADSEDADRAVENIARKQLDPYEEAKAVGAMLTRGLSEDGAAQALGWPKARVSARVKMLELPERAQQLLGAGVIALSAVDQLRAIGAVAPELLDAVIAYLDDGSEWAAERLRASPAGCWIPRCATATARRSPPTCTASARTRSQSCGSARRPSSSTPRPRSCTRQLDRYAYLCGHPHR